jgi:hypothetical protein
LTSNQDVVDYLAEIKFKVNIPDKFKFVDQNRFDIDTRLLAEKHQNSTVPTTELGPSVNTHEENFPHTSNIQRKKRRQARTLVNERASVLTVSIICFHSFKFFFDVFIIFFILLHLNFIKNVFCFFVFVIFEQNTRKRGSCFFN